MATNIKVVLLLSAVLAGCATHQVTEQTAAPTSVTPFTTMQVQVKFATEAHSDYLANQLVEQLNKHGINASVLNPAQGGATKPAGNTGLLQLTLTGSWTETFISRRTKHRRSLTQTRGRIPRESPRFRSDLVVVNRQSNEIVWQSETVTAGAWYADFNTMARSLATKLTRQLQQQGLIGSGTDPA